MKAASVGLCTTPCGVTLNWLRVTGVAMAVAYSRRSGGRTTLNVGILGNVPNALGTTRPCDGAENILLG